MQTQSLENVEAGVTDVTDGFKRTMSNTGTQAH